MEVTMRPFLVKHKKFPDKTGVAINETIMQVIDEKAPTGLRTTSIISVLWDDQLSPAPAHHSPSDLEHGGLLDEAIDEDDEEYEDEEDEEPESFEDSVTVEPAPEDAPIEGGSPDA
jgi:hypothetical protein